ncbi:MAG TPA: Ku protein [Flavobacteriales bacterium]|nr:Ku protein [Flavobacteriales bacterium]
MRSIWKGAIGFGLVNIPVKLYSATQSSTLDLDMVDKRNMGKIRFHRVNESTGREVKWENIGKAYMLDDRYVMVEDEDFEKAAPEKSKIIEVNHFVDETEIESIYYENAYYLEPEKAGAKAYALLREALTKSSKVGIAQFVMRTAEALAVIKPMGNVLVLNKIRFAEEVRSADEFNLPPKTAVKPTELKMALSLIKQYSGKFNIEKFKDQYSAALLKLIKAKGKGKKIVTPKMKVVYSKQDDLMSQLKASLSKRKAS